MFSRQWQRLWATISNFHHRDVAIIVARRWKLYAGSSGNYACNVSYRLLVHAALHANLTLCQWLAVCFRAPAHLRRRDAGLGTRPESAADSRVHFLWINVLSWVTTAQQLKSLAPALGGCSAKFISPFGVYFLWPESLNPHWRSDSNMLKPAVLEIHCLFRQFKT